MRITTKGHYGIHAMLDLARYYGQGPVLMRDLAARHGYSEKYLEQLMRDLRRRGLVRSSRGVHGGYWLAKSPKEITLLEIIETLEGELPERPAGCSSDCMDVDQCATLEIWFKGVQELRKTLARRTLSEHIRRQKQLDEKNHDKKCIV